MENRTLRTFPIFVLISALLIACGAAPQPTPQGQETLTLLTWAGYMPQEILDGFTKEYSIPVEYLIYADQDEALDRMRAGEQFDIVVLGDTHVPAAVAEGLLAELDYENIPNFRFLGSNFRDLAADPENRYSIMIQWGTTGIIARTDRLAQPITGWADLWNPDYAGDVGVWPYAQELIAITLKSLGYSANSEDPAELQEALDKMLQLRKNVYLLDATQATGVTNLMDDHTVMIFGWSYDAMEAAAKLDAALYILPQEGTMLWSDSVTIPSSSQHKHAAELFINYLLRPEVSAQMVNALGIPTPNEAALPYIRADIVDNPLIYPSHTSLKKAEFFEVLSAETQRTHEEIWSRFLAEEGPALDTTPVP